MFKKISKDNYTRIISKDKQILKTNTRSIFIIRKKKSTKHFKSGMASFLIESLVSMIPSFPFIPEWDKKNHQ